jgi:hypothetical protein
MPTIPCPDCQKQVSTLAQTCPHCGRPMRDAPPAAPSPTVAAKAPKSEGLLLHTLDMGCGFFLILIAAVVVFLVMVLFGPPSNWF